MQWLEKWRKRKARKHLNKLDRVQRHPEKIRLRYPNYTVGAGTYGIPEVHDFGAAATLRIGSYTSIAAKVNILLGGGHHTDWVSCYAFQGVFEEARNIPDIHTTKGDVEIGSDCWIGMGAMILSGVTIGHGAVVAAGAVVTKSVEPYAIVGGNPCKFIRWRFESASVRERLLATAWWNWPSDEIEAVVRLLCSDHIEAFLDYAQHRDQATSTNALQL